MAKKQKFECTAGDKIKIKARGKSKYLTLNVNGRSCDLERGGTYQVADQEEPVTPGEPMATLDKDFINNNPQLHSELTVLKQRSSKKKEK